MVPAETPRPLLGPPTYDILNQIVVTYIPVSLHPDLQSSRYAGLMAGNPDQLYTDANGVSRCWWSRFAPEFIPYHDNEWGYPVSDDIRLFEKMSLESFQSGLSWRTILNKRDAFREAFAGFDFRVVARFGSPDVERLLDNAGIVRHRGKIEATIHNAGVAIELADRYGSLAAYIWEFEPAAAERPASFTWDAISKRSKTDASIALSKNLKRHGWRFLGPTTAYAFMQAMGLVNDHQEGCHCRERAEHARAQFERPARRERQDS